MYSCPVCKQSFQTKRAILNHFIRTHNISNTEPLYLTEHEQGKCVYCERPTKYLSYFKGYKNHCGSKECVILNFKLAANGRQKKRYEGYIKKKLRFEYRDCQFCGKKFKPVQRDNAKYCSRSCSGLSRNHDSPECYTIFYKKKVSVVGKKTDKTTTSFECPVTKKIININGSKSLTLKKHLTREGIDEKWYFESFFKENILYCKMCGKFIKYKFNLLGRQENDDVFCNKHCYHKHQSEHSEEYATPEKNKRQSETMKRKIGLGLFTPEVTNSWANSKIKITVDGCEFKFRSSWEAMFWLLNQDLIYESVRIPYKNNNRNHNYIVDFEDKENRILYEIKPKSNKKDELNILKFQCAKIWCEVNEYIFKIITEDYLLKNLDILRKNGIVLNNRKLKKSLDSLIKMKEKLNESGKNNLEEIFGS